MRAGRSKLSAAATRASAASWAVANVFCAAAGAGAGFPCAAAPAEAISSYAPAAAQSRWSERKRCETSMVDFMSLLLLIVVYLRRPPPPPRDSAALEDPRALLDRALEPL